ncbi:MAG: LysM peptidoglycan-binding domain-containing protein [Clostridiales bacterium]|nr:LysM peptidoglycan-binding domain-containing protein [Clostridiales bacterium]
MIEAIYKDEKQEEENGEKNILPRNVRQIGLADKNYRIYVEDYVYTFLGRLTDMSVRGDQEKTEKGCLAILTGVVKWASGMTCLYVKGALNVEKTDVAADHIAFTEEIWKQIHQEKEEYFPEDEIVGWFFADGQLTMSVPEAFERAHLKYFGGEKVLMLMNPAEREDTFFRFENGTMVAQSGYYIYYEKNPHMQAYMVKLSQDTPSGGREETGDEAVKRFRRIIAGKKKREKDIVSKEEENAEEMEESSSFFSYAATACLAVAIVAVGVNFYRNYREVQSLQQETEAISTVSVENGLPAPTETAEDTLQGFGDTEDESQDSLETSAETEDETDEEDTSYIYKEESDTRKADRRVAELETEEAAEETEDTDSSDATSSAEKDTDSSAATSSTERDTDSGTVTSSAEKDTDGSAVTSSASRNADSSSGTSTAKEATDDSDETTSARVSSDGGEEETSAQSAVHETYVIRPGDTLYQISLDKYGSTEMIEEICDLNGITQTETIYPGQIIVLP